MAERMATLENKLSAIAFDGAANEVVISGANLRIVNGLGATDTTNGLGNVLVGYTELTGDSGDPSMPDVRTGSHNLVIGRRHSFSSFGGFIVGDHNTLSGPFASVSGGQNNVASGHSSSVSGQASDIASGFTASVSGGNSNTASGNQASISGGQRRIPRRAAAPRSAAGRVIPPATASRRWLGDFATPRVVATLPSAEAKVNTPPPKGGGFG